MASWREAANPGMAGYSCAEVSRDGAATLLRATCPNDKPRLLRRLERLNRRPVSCRSLGLKPSLDYDGLRQLAGLNFTGYASVTAIISRSRRISVRGWASELPARGNHQ